MVYRAELDKPLTYQMPLHESIPSQTYTFHLFYRTQARKKVNGLKYQETLFFHQRNEILRFNFMSDTQ